MTLRPGLTADAVAIHHETFVQAFATDATGSFTATATQRMPNIPRDFKVDSVQYSLPAGVAANASNFWTVTLKNGATTVASWTTQTGVAGQGTITANTPIALVLSTTDANLVFGAGSSPTLVFTKTGTPANLTPGTLDVHGKFVN